MLEGLAWEQFRAAGHPERFRDRIAVLVPAYNEADNIGEVLDRIPAEVCGIATAVARRRRRLPRRHRRGRPGRTAPSVARHVINRGGGAALRTGYRLLADSGAKIVVTLDADGQHLPEEMERLVEPVLDGEVAMAHGSRVLGEAEPEHRARELGIVFFNRVVSFITRTKVTDCSNGYRAVRADVLPSLVLRQEQFHTSEFMIEAIKRGIPAKEVPVTVVSRLSGPLEEAGGRPLRDGLRQRDLPDLAALGQTRAPGGPRRGRAGRGPRRRRCRPGRRASAPRRSAGTGARARRPRRGRANAAISPSTGSTKPIDEPDEERAALGAADDPGREPRSGDAIRT